MLSDWQTEALEVVRREGVADLPALPPEKMKELKDFLLPKPTYNGHVLGHSNYQPQPLQDAIRRRQWPMFCALEEDVIRAPYLIELAMEMHELVKEYFQGEEPNLYSVNIFWTQPAPTRYRDTHNWHRDPDDRKQMAMFLYGEDVLTVEQGAHLYQKGSNVLDCTVSGSAAIQAFYESKDGQPINRPIYQCPADKCKIVLGPAGTRFLSDPSGLHMGVPPNKLRMLFWARWAPGRQTIRDKYWASNPELHDRLALTK